MSSWYQLIIQEAHRLEGRSRYRQEEEEYEKFKRILQGKHIEPSPGRREFLKQYKSWGYTIGVEPDEGETLTRGRAILKAKEEFFHPETGAPHFFEPQQTLRIGNIEADLTDDGWVITIMFRAQFKRKGGKRVIPSGKELEDLGFWLDEDVPQEAKFRVLISISKTEAPTKSMEFQLAKPEIKGKLSFLSSAKIVASSAIDDGNQWVLQVDVEGIPNQDELPRDVHPI